MVGKCCVPNCRGNYDKGNRVSVFKFPAQKEQRSKWLAAICRENYVINENSVVCEMHFNSSDVMRETVFYSEDGQEVILPLHKPRLAPGAVPSILPNCPAYLSKKNTRRECPEEKKMKRECCQLQQAINESAAQHTEFISSRIFFTFEEFKSKLNLINVGKFWDTLVKENLVAFLNVTFSSAPKINCVVQVSNTLDTCVYIGDMKVNSVNDFSVPNSVHNIDEINNVLQKVEDFVSARHSDESASNILFLISELLNSVDAMDTSFEKPLQFIKEQVEVLSSKKRKYSPCFLVFYALVHSISPHCYRYIRSSGYIILPHESTIRKFCTSFGYGPHLEQSNNQFLRYISSKFSNSENDKYVILMMDEVYIKPMMDYKGGNLVGAAVNSDSLANSAYCFMISSLLSSFKEVVHIVAVKTLTGEELHHILRKVIIGLEKIGFQVMCVVSDNNGVNRRCMQLFSDVNQLTFKYKHPCDASRPLFFILDSVHILKSLRGNWLKQKDKDICFKYPNFDSDSNDVGLQGASFQSIRQLHLLEHGKLIKYSYGLTLKALYPSSFECQNVKLVLQIFNENIVESLNILGKKENLPYYEGTAKFIEIILNWWHVVNVKTPFKGIRKNNVLMKPISNDDKDERVSYLKLFLEWLQRWKNLKLRECLTNETMNAITLTTAGLLELQEYCFQKLNFKYFLPGKIQTDMLEDRFGKYRQLAGGQYNISLRQLYEVENKIRLQSSLPNKISLSSLGEINMKECNSEYSAEPLDLNSTNMFMFLEKMIFSDVDAEKCRDDLPVLMYIAGYVCFAVLKKIQCSSCREIIVDCDDEADDSLQLIRNKSRGGLLAPSLVVSNIILYNYLIVCKLINELEREFLKVSDQRKLVLEITMSVVDSLELIWEPKVCDNGHTAEYLCKKLLWVSTNILLNNYCKTINSMSKNPAKRKNIVFSSSK